MNTRVRPLSREEIQRALLANGRESVPPILSPEQLGQVLGLSRKTIYEWLARGRLDGAFRKRGKHILVWRDRALNLIFNGPDWS